MEAYRMCGAARRQSKLSGRGVLELTCLGSAWGLAVLMMPVLIIAMVGMEIRDRILRVIRWRQGSDRGAVIADEGLLFRRGSQSGCATADVFAHRPEWRRGRRDAFFVGDWS